MSIGLAFNPELDRSATLRVLRRYRFGEGTLLSAAATALALPRAEPVSMPWIGVQSGASYFTDDTGAAWTPIGQNDAIEWVEFAGLYRRRDVAAVERHLDWLAASGVTCLRFMLEYAHKDHRFLERPYGVIKPAMVQLWDDLFAMCEVRGLRILLTPVDTFWMWLRWHKHPWNRALGGPLDHPSQLLTCPDTRVAIKARLEFMVSRWGGSGALFAWDLWNEIHPAQAGDSAECFPEFIADLSQHVRALEQNLYGRSHPQTVSLFGPELWWRPEMPLADPIFRHPDLDFATIHIYREGSIDDPKDTVAPAVAMGKVVRMCLGETRDGRPFLDTEHGPIHRFKDKRRTLPEPFDDEYFRHLSWAHLASGAAGGGMRWPNRKPHVLTPGMRRAQKAMTGFLPLVDWPRLQRRNLNEEVRATGFHRFACGDERQAVVWLLRRQALAADGRIDMTLPPAGTSVEVPGLANGWYSVKGWDTINGALVDDVRASSTGGRLRFTPAPISADRAFVITALPRDIHAADAS